MVVDVDPVTEFELETMKRYHNELADQVTPQHAGYRRGHETLSTHINPLHISPRQERKDREYENKSMYIDVDLTPPANKNMVIDVDLTPLANKNMVMDVDLTPPVNKKMVMDVDLPAYEPYRRKCPDSPKLHEEEPNLIMIERQTNTNPDLDPNPNWRLLSRQS